MRASVVVSASLLVLLAVMGAVCGSGDALAPSHAEAPEACCGIIHCSIAVLAVPDVNLQRPTAIFQAGAMMVPASAYHPPIAPPPELLIVSAASLAG